jgi:hypothetical protein
MKYIKSIAVAAGLACAAVSSQANVVLSYASTANSVIQFTPTGFSFVNTTTPGSPTFSVGNSSGTSANGDSIGDLGTITGGPFVITSINGAGNQGTVSGSGTLTIADGHGNNLTGSISWSTIGQIGNGNILNLNGIINLSSIAYSGPSVDLKALANVTAGIQTVSFSFSGSSPSLAQLQAGNVSDSFSGQISSTSPVPEPTTVIAGALLLLPFGLSTLRIIRKNSAATVA